MSSDTVHLTQDSKHQHHSDAECASCKQASGDRLPNAGAGYPTSYKLGLVAVSVIACLISAPYMRSRMIHGPIVLGSSGLPSLPSYELDPEIANNLGAYSARYEVPSNIPSKIPEGCEVTMINVLQRHGARYPTVDAGEDIDAALAKVKKARDVTDPTLKFAPEYNFTFVAEQLVLFGQNQSYISGQIIAEEYSRLGSRNFVRSAPKQRIVESSRWWRQGFEGGPFTVPISGLPEPDVILRWANSTLNITTCVAAEELKPRPGHVASKKWRSVYAPPITARLNKLLPGAKLHNGDTVALMGLCGFDTAARNGAPSPWCDVFSADEFKSFEYYEDLEEYYNNSYGSVYGPSEGVGWVNELLSRLTGEPVHDDTTTNHTLDDDMSTFPYGPSGPSIFADFSSDENIVKIISAMGILRDSVHLPKTGPIPPNRQFYISKMVPFAGSVTVEKLHCSARDTPTGEGHFVRIFVNSAVVPLNFQSCGDLGTTLGICPLDGFVESQVFARTGGKWNECFEGD